MITIDKTKYYSKTEVAARLQCSVATVNKKIWVGQIRGTYFGRRVHYTEEQIKAIAESGTQMNPKKEK